MLQNTKHCYVACSLFKVSRGLCTCNQEGKIELSDKYIGTQQGNRGDVWIKTSDGVYACKNRTFTLSESEVIHDIMLGYLKAYQSGEEDIYCIGQLLEEIEHAD